nr:MAG TPA: hypothetical protein [Caudoviricetes sp.]
MSGERKHRLSRVHRYLTGNKKPPIRAVVC